MIYYVLVIILSANNYTAVCAIIIGEKVNIVCISFPHRPYYHVWSSQNPQQHLLLPPAQGVTWSGGYKRTPLFDPDPHNQSLHYLRWSKPSSSHDRSHLDAVGKQTTQGAVKRFLLSGPPQVRTVEGYVYSWGCWGGTLQLRGHVYSWGGTYTAEGDTYTVEGVRYTAKGVRYTAEGG